jgi:hypothetical protein
VVRSAEWALRVPGSRMVFLRRASQGVLPNAARALREFFVSYSRRSGGARVSISERRLAGRTTCLGWGRMVAFSSTAGRHARSLWLPGFLQ